MTAIEYLSLKFHSLLYLITSRFSQSNIIKAAWCVVLFFLTLNCSSKIESKEYKVNFSDQIKIEIDGKREDLEWSNAIIENRFSLPWEDRQASLTEFCALYDDSLLYFSYFVHDNNLVIDEEAEEQSVVPFEDRVEIFFSRDENLDEYYCVEFDPLGRILSYSASYYRQFDDTWELDGLISDSFIFDGGYSIEGTIPLKTLQSLGLLDEDNRNELNVGLFRADFSNTSNGSVDEHWISWIDPQVESPDFHIPGAFGALRFMR